MVGADSLLGSTGDKHRLTKKLIISVFTPAVLASFVPRIQAVIRSHVERWCQMCSEEGFMHGFPACQRLSADIAMEVILGFGSGTRSRSDGHPNSEELLTALITFVDNLFSVPVRIPGGGFWKGMRAREVLLQAVRQKLDESSTRADADFLSIVELLQEVQCPDGTCLRDNRPVIEDNALEMFFASYSTTSSALCSALLCLGRDPEVLGKVEAELREHGLMDERAEVTYDELNKLQYVHCVNREVLRLYPPAGAGFRKAEQTLQIGGYQIPEGWTVAYSIRETQHTSSEFTDTERFQPERWMASEGDELKERLRFHYIPFGSGARACVGRRLATMVQAIFVVELVRRSKWTVWNPWPTVKYVPVTRPADNLPVTFRHRTHTEENEAER
nr:hypothetical protein BaRGS_009854 [Batillaria attramentaria]